LPTAAQKTMMSYSSKALGKNINLNMPVFLSITSKTNLCKNRPKHALKIIAKKLLYLKVTTFRANMGIHMTN
jgi:hypothetical protein